MNISFHQTKVFNNYFVFILKFKQIMDAQFLSFNDAAHITSFETLSASIFKWLEEQCKPQVL